MIINTDHIRAANTIAVNIDDKRLEKYILEVETLWVINALTPVVYKRIEESVLMDNNSHPITDNNNNLITFTHLGDYDTLLVGGYYDQNRQYLAGLIQAVSYLAFSRFVKHQQANVTAFGVVIKSSQFSEPASDALVLKTSKDAEKIGLAYLEQCRKYLNFKNELFPNKNIKRKFKAIGK